MSSYKKIHLQRDYAVGVYLSEAQNPIPPALHTVHYTCIHTVYFLTQGRGGGGEPERRGEGEQFTKLGQKYHHD
jgi:hypothetical protein